MRVDILLASISSDLKFTNTKNKKSLKEKKNNWLCQEKNKKKNKSLKVKKKTNMGEQRKLR